MGIQVKLTRSEIFKAIRDYVEKEYELNVNYSTINVQNNNILDAEIDCDKKINMCISKDSWWNGGN